MQRSRAAIGSAVFFIAAPGTVVGLIPWLITDWEFREPLPYWIVARAIGAILVVIGLVPVVHAFTEFARAGGTPAPVTPTEHLVVSGFNRYIRNPMYTGLIVVLIGQALLFGQLVLILYAAAMWAVTAMFVHWYEEPTLTNQYGTQYDAYRNAVPAWWPRLHPWETSQDPSKR